MLTASGIKDSDLKYVSKIAGEASVAFDMIADEAGTVYTGIKKAIGLQNFNSKIVQLKDCPVGNYIVARITFQFQYGTIKSNFRFPLVFRYCSISIPIWYN